MRTEPTWRMPAGMFAIIALIGLLGFAVASASAWIWTMPKIAQVAIYLVAGIVWIAPLKPLLRWMETGRFGKPPLE